MTLIKGKVYKDRLTKKVIHLIKKNDIPVISHKGLDLVAAQDLKYKKVKAIINCDSTIDYGSCNDGIKYLIESNINVFDVGDKEFFNIVQNGDNVIIDRNQLFLNNIFCCYCKQIIKQDIDYASHCDYIYHSKRMDFITNTIEYMKEELDYFFNSIMLPDISLNIEGKEVLIISRGRGYRQDLKLLRSFIINKKPILISVDGGADALSELGFSSDIIIGDMDSISDRSLQNCNEILIHSYINGYAPGLDRINSLNINYKLISSKGTSEDAAVLFAVLKGASIIYTVGSHTCIDEFIEKGRRGMSSTILLRMLYSTKIVDLKGVSRVIKYNRYNYLKSSIFLIFITVLISLMIYKGFDIQYIISGLKTVLSIK